MDADSPPVGAVGVGLCGLVGGLLALHQSLKALKRHSLRLGEQNI